jgi:monoterpene epsilon-lactone hydrolase
MISHQARLTKHFIKSATKKSVIPIDIPQQRRMFEKNMRILFPTLSSRYVKRGTVAGVPVEWITPNTSARRIIIYVHGGAFALGSSRAYRQHMVRLARLSNARILSVEYSLAPEHPYPHAIDELHNVWTELIGKKHNDPSHIAFAGDSAGANILLATAIKLRDTQLPLPACLVLLSAGLDATFSGESYMSNASKDVLFTQEALDFYMRNYVQHHDKKHPHVSPIFADLRGLPPMLIHVGSEEMMLDTSKKLYENARRDSVDATLFIGQGMWHGWHLFAGFVPEAKTAMQEIGRYIKDRT